MNSTTARSERHAAYTTARYLDLKEAIDEAFVRENDSQPAFVLSASHRTELVAAVYALPEPDHGRNRKKRYFLQRYDRP